MQEDVEVENTVLDDAMEADVITEPKFESVVDDELETEVETFAETAVTGLKTVGKTAVTNAEDHDKDERLWCAGSMRNPAGRPFQFLYAGSARRRS